MRRIAQLVTILSLALASILQSTVTAQTVRAGLKADESQLNLKWTYRQLQTEAQVLQLLNGELGATPAEFRVTCVARGRDGVVFHVFYQNMLMLSSASDTKPWHVKKVFSVEEASSFVNSEGAYAGQSAKSFRICAAQRPFGQRVFFIFYRETTNAAGGWGWKILETVEDVHKFLSHQGGYAEYVKEAEVAALGNKFYVFYVAAKLAAPPAKPWPSWGWVKRETPESAVDILNTGTGGPPKTITKARIGAVLEPPYTVFYIFYQ